ncbi:hypothetical protein CRUP_012196 [Coryphaenoides rupestris]|nr:hypothetical protein CRUP_012196 [Coryphaenoides rupestris]
MRLRSRRNLADGSPTTTRKKRDDDAERSFRVRRRSLLLRTRSPKATPKKVTPKKREVLRDVFVDLGTPMSEDEVPMATRRPRGRKRAIAVEDVSAQDTEHAFTTPIRPPTQRSRLLAKTGRTTPRNATSRSIYSPLVRFLTPSKENSSSPAVARNILMSPEEFVFGYGSMGLLAGEEEAEDIFSPFTFIKNIPARSQQCKPCHRDIPPKMRSTPNGTLVLDLVYVVLRPYVREFLQAMAKVYEMFVYTSAKKGYAEKLLDILDPQKKLFRHRLYQEHCTCVLGHYIKDLAVLERDLGKTLMNTVPIKSWSGEQSDRELQRLVQYMEKLSSADDFRDVLKRRKDHIHRLLSEG